MYKLVYKTNGTCSTEIEVNIEHGTLISVSFKSGCEASLQGICKLVEGMPVHEVIKKLKGIDCEGKGTSCPDQLSKALEEALKSKVLCMVKK